MPVVRHVSPPVVPAVAVTIGSVAAGGPVAALQDSLAERLQNAGVAPALAAPYAPDRLESVIVLVSRAAGFVALAAGIAATLWLIV